MGVVRAIRSMMGWSVALVATVVFGIVAVVVGAVGGGDRALVAARLWARICLRASGCRVRVEGLDRIDPDRRYVIMANHQSALDIPVLLAVLPAAIRATFWGKDSLFSIPFMGSALRAMGFIPVDRTDRSTAAAMFATSLERVAAGRSLTIFPEETYGPGHEMLPFQRGGFLLALKAGLPVLPVGIHGTRAALPPRSRSITPGPITVRIGPPLVTRDLKASAREELTREVREALTVLAADG